MSCIIHFFKVYDKQLVAEELVRAGDENVEATQENRSPVREVIEKEAEKKLVLVLCANGVTSSIFLKYPLLVLFIFGLTIKSNIKSIK